MACPICGAICKCKNAGPGGICCDCHHHKPRTLKADFVIDRPEWDELTRKAVEAHRKESEIPEEEPPKPKRKPVQLELWQ
jgi:hypothetical protein